MLSGAGMQLREERDDKVHELNAQDPVMNQKGRDKLQRYIHHETVCATAPNLENLFMSFLAPSRE